MKTGNEIRALFLDYFRGKEHRIVKSSSLIPHDDPTLLFTNAGMVQFKRTFLGEEKRDYSRAATSQKCVRAGGKHNDLENVGHTARHHTFFEMLGNFSFGDYFKELAVELAWDLLVNGCGLPVEKLWVSVYTDDDEAADLWQNKVGVRPDRIVRLGEKDNFWAMGDTGPCGPCSEIHIDRGPEFGCGKPDCQVGCECDRYLEIWNLVFMQYNRDEAGVMTPLPRPSIDTGMGLERIASVMQNAPTNYETDLFTPIIGRIEELAEKKMSDSMADAVSMKVIADHSRAAAFLIGDGVLPSNEGRGYVLRRIMRRAIRYGRQLGLEKPFLHDTAAKVAEIMEPAYPELSESLAFIRNVIVNEENRFRETLDHGLMVLNDTLADLKAKGDTLIPGEAIFRLYDTYGFPMDIVEDVALPQGFTLDADGFEKSMARQREQSRTKTAFAGAGEAVKNLAGAGQKTKFTGYNATLDSGRVLAIVKDGAEAETASAGDEIQVITDKTPFYGESGGQAGDTGRIFAGELSMAVDHTSKDPTGLFIHHGKVASGEIKRGQFVEMEVDREQRAATALNHTATHLLHAALRQVVGEHAKQAGSSVGPDRLRFDFTHFEALTREQMDEIEDIVNQRIRENESVCVTEMEADKARETGAMALFEEKYGDTVRVVSMGEFSKELCGGTHTDRTGDVGAFVILAEASVASGVRRIEALTGKAAVDWLRNTRNTLSRIAALMKDNPENAAERVEKLLEKQKEQEKEIKALKVKLATAATGGGGGMEVAEVDGIKVLAQKVDADTTDSLREAGDRFRDKLGSGVVVLGAETNGKALVLAMVSKDLTKSIRAGDIVKRVAQMVGGGGGGRPDMAQAGGSKPENLDQAMAAVPDIVKELKK